MIVGALALLFLVLFWRWNRRTGSGKATYSLLGMLLLYELVFVAGEVHLLFLIAGLKWPRGVLFLGIASWGVYWVLGCGIALSDRGAIPTVPRNECWPCGIN
jgi:hypothetical protein